VSPAGPPATSAALDDLAREYWEGALEADPLLATLTGDRRFDDRMPDLTPEARESRSLALADLGRRVEAVDAAGLSPEERVTRLQLLALVRDGIDERATGIETWLLDPLEGPQVALLNLPSWHTVRTRHEAEAFVARIRAMGPYLAQHRSNLERGHAAGLASAEDPARKVLVQLEALLAQPVDAWTLVTEPAGSMASSFDEPTLESFQRACRSAVEEEVRPQFVRLMEFVREKGLPAARPRERAGIGWLPGGRDTYGRLLRIHTSLPLTAEAVHATGLAEVARIDAEMAALGTRTLGEPDLAAVRARLRGDEALHFTTRDEVEAKAVEALARAEAAVPKWFGRLPVTPCVVRRIEAHEEEFSTIAYYRQPSTDGSRPGTYYINTFAPNTRPRYEAEALAFHEAVPGHHTQIALAQEMPGVPEFRRHTGPTSYVEGWALYTERLCDEMGLYGGDLDRIGMLSFDAWRACRLVVDSGLHAMGWSRTKAIDFMVEHTALARNNIENEVDRYIGWPGQATAYKTGQLEILRLRREAEARLGAGFDVRRFHDIVLGHGAVGLETLRAIVESEAG
jgi:uncharacterized protein (DUF885 family)